MFSTTVPWLLAVVTALCFAWLAQRAKRNWLLWGVGGLLLGLATSTIIFGLGHASSTPFSDHERTMLLVKCTLVAVVVLVALGWLFTMGLHQQHLILLRKGPPSSSASVPANPTQGERPAESAKQSPERKK